MPIPNWLKPIRQKIGNDLLLIPGVSAMIFNEQGEVLLQQRADNGKWSTIGGIQEPGEEPAEAVVREVMEETGLRVTPEMITGVYATPIAIYPNGDKVQYTITQFRCILLDPNQRPIVSDDESLALKFVALNQLPDDIHAEWAIRIRQAAEARKGAGTAKFRFRGEWRQ
jgi:8-oxo-dGTP diphosphatase